MTLRDADRGYLARCVELAAEAVAHGDDPFGSLLVDADGTVLFEDRNRTGYGCPARGGRRTGAGNSNRT